MCRICQHDHKLADGGQLLSPTSSSTLASSLGGEERSITAKGIASIPIRRAQKVKPVARAEKLRRTLLASGLVETVSIVPARRGANDSESKERHFVANILVVENVDGSC